MKCSLDEKWKGFLRGAKNSLLKVPTVATLLSSTVERLDVDDELGKLRRIKEFQF